MECYAHNVAEHYMKKEYLRLGNFMMYGLAILLASGCALTQTKYEREYARVWKELIKSKAWQESLLAEDKNAEIEEFYVSTEDDMVLIDDIPVSDTNSSFGKEYESLVSKAYFKIITEAEKADARITAEYKLLMGQVVSEKGVKENSLEKRQERMTRKYEAHKAMLEGLKSWNIFSENRSGDLDYFKTENKEVIQDMMQKGDASDQIVSYLIYKLADLYHLED